MPRRTSDFSTLAFPHERDACGVGFVADIQGRKSRHILEKALAALVNLEHRGAVSADGLTGDGAGVLTQLPHKFFRRVLSSRGIAMGPDEDLGVGTFFVENTAPVDEVFALIASVIEDSPLGLLCWREMPIDDSSLGELARRRRPVMRQILVQRPSGYDGAAFERLLYLTRKRISQRISDSGLGRFYIPSFSSRTISYKGLMVAPQLSRFYLDLADPDFETSIAVFHQRYSTNTAPRWSLAQPFRFLAHNGEINTLQGNVNLMKARESVLESDLWGADIEELLPIIEPRGSDSAALDNVFELLTLSGRDPMETILMLVPEAFEENDQLDPQIKGMFEYNATLMEPWDGPAAIALSDGRYAVAALDRNGLRPQRYWRTRDDVVIVGSEAGMVAVPEENVIEKGRLEPGTMLAVDTVNHRLWYDHEIKHHYAQQKPYREWVNNKHVIPEPEPVEEIFTRPWDETDLKRAQLLFGYSREDYDRIFEPMVFDASIPVGSMGDDTPLAVLSEQPQLIYRYFKQRFAQVTNPPIDPLRERMVMSLETVVGPRGSILERDEDAARVLKFASPLLDEAGMNWLNTQTLFQHGQLKTRFKVEDGPKGLIQALDQICDEATEAVSNGCQLLILSDRIRKPEYAPIPMLLAVGAVHHHLIRMGKRTKTAIVVETGEAREDHHFACLIGYGAALVHPYLALASVRDVAASTKNRDPLDLDQAVKNYFAAVEKGLLKIMSKMGISALSSYRAAQIFEAIGIKQSLIDQCFSGTPSRIGGVGREALAYDVLRFHAAAYAEEPGLPDLGLYRFRKAGEYHALNPQVFKALHKAVRNESFEAYSDYARLVDERPATNIRDLLEYRRVATPLALEEIESVEAIVKRFTTQAMSHGSVSRETHETLAVAMNTLGAKSNSGEGGEDEVRFKPYEEDRPDLGHEPSWYPKQGDWANSAIKQVASGRFGVTPNYLVSAREIEIKMAQGSKPGEGGQIPGHKVNHEIARIRRSVPGVTLISPPPHHDIYSIEDLAQLIFDLKRVNKNARVGVKLVSTAGVGTIAAGVAKGYADNIQISGNDGGTGASPLSSVKHAGVGWELGLSETQQVLVEQNLRGRVSLRVDGGMKTGRDVVIGALLGAEEFGFGTSALVAAGCAMIRQCHLNTCPVGVATQRADLRAKYPGQPEHVMNFMFYVAQQVRMILAEMGFRSLDEVIGRVDLLKAKEVRLAKAAEINLEAILKDPSPNNDKVRRSQQLRNDRPFDQTLLDDIIIEDCELAIEHGERVRKHYYITNRGRSIGARLSGEIARVYGAKGLPAGTIQLSFTGSSGQSFGVFNNRGMHLTLMGDAQDYVGKGMYGGEIVVRLKPHAKLISYENAIVGNTVMYGATGGSLFAAGKAGERFCVRNSGGRAVVEGCGDHGCEYMTGGVAVILGRTGRNFGAGMSGGIAYVYDPEASFERNLNSGMVGLERVASDIDEELLKTMIQRHYDLTESHRAEAILANWQQEKMHFWKVAPHPALEDDSAIEQDVKVLEQRALEALLDEAARLETIESIVAIRQG